ncbi:cytochrome c oxidase subunit 6A1, mitochondrial-like [Chelonus insularis]|uniref:cytochrome c oxidase subunit 6A1, mitochondrial-like n=1 Tax=Chelonus insularis TaxID=460826 RepID=UPI00158C42F4|nr:cytochrome c oxidase subunit 6A1, mitochondrial-like [Chelonus insularis]
MATRRILRPFHILKRNFSKEVVDDYSFVPGEKPIKDIDKSIRLWRNLTYFVGFPSIIITGINAYLLEKEFEETFERPEYVEYEYLSIINKPWPWGDGKHSLFFNPERNAIRGIGYEAPWGHGHHK